MFVVDSSVLVAIVMNEPESAAFRCVMETTEQVYVGWPTLLETWSVLAPRITAQKADASLEKLLKAGTLQAIEFDQQHYTWARQAYERFRIGGHPARLNLGDTMSYALARVMDLPLLFKGRDFGLTDVKVHPASVLA
jgi:ribonuclease VapC